jgi:cell division septal protein FtsQ
MLGDFIYSGDVEDAAYQYDTAYQYNTPADNDKAQKIEKTVKKFLALAAVFVSIGLVWVFAVSPALVPVKIDVKSFQGFNKAEVLNFAGIRSGATYVSISAQEAEELLSKHPMV